MVGPGSGDLACGEVGSGRLAEPHDILDAIERAAAAMSSRWPACKALVTSGPTHEPIDPVRYIANRSSGKQGHAIAAALAELGAETLLVSGPTREPDPAGVAVRHVETAARDAGGLRGGAAGRYRGLRRRGRRLARRRRPATRRSRRTAARRRVAGAGRQSRHPRHARRSPGPARPRLVVGFAAETEQVVEHAEEKLQQKGCDWILANDVSAGTGTFGGDANTIHLVAASGVEDWPTPQQAGRGASAWRAASPTICEAAHA